MVDVRWRRPAFCKPEGHKDVDYLAQCIEQFNVTVLHFVPSMFALYLANADTQHQHIKTVFCSGEALDMASATRYRDVFPNALLANLYGPTEAAIDVSWYNCDTLTHPFVPIGKPINNIKLFIVNAFGRRLPPGVAGELCIAGDGVAKGC